MNKANPFAQDDFDMSYTVMTFANQRKAKYPEVRDTAFDKTELESFRDGAQAPTPPIKPIVGYEPDEA